MASGSGRDSVLFRNESSDSVTSSDISTSAESSGRLYSPKSSPEKENFVGNVSNHVPLPSKHSGHLHKGNLVFDACFEGGLVLELAHADYIVL